MSEFADFNFDLTIIKPGTRYATNVPLFKTSTTYNRMELNAAAALLCEVKEDDRILIFDNNKEVKDVNAIYYFIIHPTQGARLSGDSRKAFSYAGPYAGMVIGDPTLHTGNDTDLEKANLLAPGIKGKSALYTVEYTVVKTGKQYPFNGEMYEVYALTNRTQNEVNRDLEEEDTTAEQENVHVENASVDSASTASDFFNDNE